MMQPDIDLPCMTRTDVYDQCVVPPGRRRVAADRRAKAICATCEHVLECLRENGDTPYEGVVGGMTLQERAELGMVVAA